MSFVALAAVWLGSYGLIACLIVAAQRACSHVHDFATTSGRCGICGASPEPEETRC